MYIIKVGLCKVWCFQLFFLKAIEEIPLGGRLDPPLGTGRVKNCEFVLLTLRIKHMKNNVMANGPATTVVFHIYFVLQNGVGK